MEDGVPQGQRTDAALAVERVYRDERAAIVAGLIRLCGDFPLAEDVVQDAFSRALEAWEQDGIPPNPAGWVTTTARRRAIDVIRRAERFRKKREVVGRLERAENEPANAAVTLPGEDGPQDDRLRLLFTCCHPALSVEAQVALTLRVVGGLTTREIARAFLVADTTMGQRLVRARNKIRDAGIPFRVPAGPSLEARLDAALKVIYLVFNEGYAATEGDRLMRGELCEEAIRLARLLGELMPDEPEPSGLLALLLLHHARRGARVRDGTLVLLDDQDRTLWDRNAITEGSAIVDEALRRGRVGPYQIQAAIAAAHCRAGTPAETDWREISAWYDVLGRVQPTPVVRLNRAVAVAMAGDVERGLALLDTLASEASLDGYHLFHSARADLLRRLGRTADAAEAYRRALRVCSSPVERAFLEGRLSDVG
jgi:RNA polymerase sigma-70 factor, ECF subfamily